MQESLGRQSGEEGLGGMPSAFPSIVSRRPISLMIRSGADAEVSMSMRSTSGDQIACAALVRDGGAVHNSLYGIGVDGSDARLLVDGAMQGQWRPR